MEVGNTSSLLWRVVCPGAHLISASRCARNCVLTSAGFPSHEPEGKATVSSPRRGLPTTVPILGRVVTARLAHVHSADREKCQRCRDNVCQRCVDTFLTVALSTSFGSGVQGSNHDSEKSLPGERMGQASNVPALRDRGAAANQRREAPRQPGTESSSWTWPFGLGSLPIERTRRSERTQPMET